MRRLKWILSLAGLLSLAACAPRKASPPSDVSLTFQDPKGGVTVYHPIASHPFRETVVLTRRQPVSKWLSSWRLISIAPDGFTRLKLTIPETTVYIGARPGQEFPRFGNIHMKLIEASATKGTAKIEEFAQPW